MWIESHGNLSRHPKTRRLMQRMGWTLPFTLGNLHLLWWWALDFAPTGDLTHFEPDQITADLDLGDATPEQFLEAMVAAGFLDRFENGTLCIHDWVDYTSKSRRSPRALSGSSSRPVHAGQHPEPIVPPRRDSSRPANAGQNQNLPVPPRRDASSSAARDFKLIDHGPQRAVQIDLENDALAPEQTAPPCALRDPKLVGMDLRAVRRISSLGSALHDSHEPAETATADCEPASDIEPESNAICASASTKTFTRHTSSQRDDVGGPPLVLNSS